MTDIVTRIEDLEREQLLLQKDTQPLILSSQVKLPEGQGSNIPHKFADKSNGLNVSFGDPSLNPSYHENYSNNWQVDDPAFYVPQFPRDNSQNCTRGCASHRVVRNGTTRRRETSTSCNIHRSNYAYTGNFNHVHDKFC